MKKFRFAVLTVVGFLMVLTITTCKKTVALGSTVDILPPTNSFDRPVKGDSRDSLRGSFSLNGVAKDDSGVRAVKLIFKSKTPGVNVEKTYMTKLDSPGVPETNWSVNITNEWTGKYLDSYNLIKEYPLPDSEYEISIITIDKQGREATHTTVLTIDNTPPVFIVDNFTDAREKDELGITAGTQTFGSILNVIGTAGDTSDIQSLKVTAYSSDGTKKQKSEPIQLGGTKQINNNIATTKVIKVSELTSGDYYDFWQLQGADLKDKNIIMDIFLSDKAQPFGSQGTESGNISEFFYLRDDLQKVMAEKGYTVQTFSDYISGRKGWDDSQSSKQLEALIEDTDTLRILNEKRYWNYKEGEGTATTPPVNVDKDKVVFQLAPGARPGYTVTNYAAIGAGETIPPMYADSRVTITVERNADKTKVADPDILAEIHEADLKLQLIQMADGSTLDAFISQLQTNPTETGAIAAIKTLFDKDTLNDISDPYKFTIAGDINFSIQFKLPADTKVGKTYALILQGHDVLKHDLIVYGDESKPLADKFVIFEVKATGNPPQIDVTKLPTDWTNKKLDVTFNIIGARDEVKVTIDDTIDITEVKVAGDNYALGSDGKGLDLSTVSGLTEGEHTLTVYAKQGDLHSERKCTFRYDKTKPVIKITEPTAVGADGQTTTTFDSWSPTFTLKVDEGKDPTTLSSMSPRKSLKFQISYDNGATFEAKEYNASLINGNDEYEAIVNVTKPSFAVKFIAEDMAGNTTELQTTSFTVSTDKPQIETVKATVQTVGDFVDITGNTGNIGTYISKKLVDDHGFDIQVIAKKYIQTPGTTTLVEDTHVKVNKVEFVNGASTATIDPYDCTDNTKNTIHSDKLGLTSTNMADRVPVTIRAIAADGKQQETTLTFRVDSTPPELKITSPVADGQAIDGNTKIAGYAADSESGIKEASQGYTYKIVNTADNSVVPGASGSLKWDNQTNPTEWTIPNPFTVNQAEGEFKIIIDNIRDDAGNTLPEVEKKVTIDKNPPKIADATIYRDTTKVEHYPYLTNDKATALHFKGSATDTNKLKSVKLTVARDGAVYYEDTKNDLSPDGKTIDFDFEFTTPNQSGKSAYEDGSYSLVIVAEDAAGKLSPPITRQMTIDTTPPEITASTTNGVWQKSTNVNVTGGTASDAGSGLRSVQYAVGTTAPAANAADWKDLTLLADNKYTGYVTLNEGENNVWYKATDNAGNTTITTGAHTIKVDTQAPTLTISSPTGPVKTNQTSFEVGVKTGDDGSGVDTIEYGTDPTFKASTTAPCTTSPQIIAVNGVSATGTYYFRAVDNAGNPSALATIQVVLDTELPTVKLDDTYTPKVPIGSTIHTNGTITISGSASDNDKIKNVTITKADGSGLAAGSVADLPPDGTLVFNSAAAARFSFNLDTTKYDDNTTLTLKATAVDESGNKSDTELTLNIKQDTDRPIIVIQNLEALTGTNNYLKDATLRGTVKDDDGEIAKIIINDGTDHPVTVSGGSWEYQFTNDGAKTLTFAVTDKKGKTFTTGGTDKPVIYAKNENSVSTTGKVTFTVDTKDPVIAEVTGKLTSETNDQKLDVKSLFKAEEVIFTVKATDSSGIKSVEFLLDGTKITAGTITGAVGEEQTVTAAHNFAGETNTTHKHKLVITVTDGSGRAPQKTYTIRIDGIAPATHIMNFDTSQAQTGTITVKGMISDEGGAGVDKDALRYKIVKNGTTPSITDTDWTPFSNTTVGTWEITDLNLGTYFSLAGTTYSSDYATEIGSGLFKLLLHVLVKDTVGNAKVVPLSITVDPAGDRPTVEIVEPNSPLSLGADRILSVGGKVSVFGSARVKKGYVGEVYMDAATDSGFTDFVTGWKDKKIDGTANWRTVLNADGEIDALMGSDPNKVIYYRVYAKNGETGARGGYSATYAVKFDKSAPTIGSPTLHKDGDPTGISYIAREWIKGDASYLTMSLNDDSGISKVNLQISRSGTTIVDKSLTGATEIEGYQIDGNAVFTEQGTSSGGYHNYDVKIPLKTNGQTGGEYTVTVTITEGVATGTKLMTQTGVYTFRFDNEASIGEIGAYQSSGRSAFNGTTIPAGMSATAGMHLYVNKQVIDIVDNSGTPQLATALNGEYEWVLFEDKNYFNEATATIKGIAYDGGGSEVKEITGTIVDTANTKKANFTVTGKDIRPRIGGFVSWEAPVDVSALDDGAYTVQYTIHDYAGNQSNELTKTIYIKRKAIHILKVHLGTDLNRNTAISDAERVGYAELNGVQDKYTFDWNGEVKANDFTCKSTVSDIKVEYTGGNGEITYTLKKGSTSIKTGSLQTDPNASDYRTISLTDAEFANIGDGLVTLELTLTDTCGWTSTETITVNVKTIDDTPSKAAVLPFYWNSSEDNSLIWGKDKKKNLYKLGHIEFDGFNDGSTYTGRPAVSGRIVVEGTVYDETLLQGLTVNAGNLQAVATLNNADNSWTQTSASEGLALEAKTVLLDQSGHYVSWKLTWDTEKVSGKAARGITVKVTPTDLSGQPLESVASSVGTGQGARPANNKLGVTDITGIKVGQTVRLYTGAKEAYYTQIESINTDKKELTLSSAIDVSIKNYDIYRDDHNTHTITVDVVPYISAIVTPLAEKKKADLTELGRSALGEYSVKRGDRVKIYGFNLNSPQSENKKMRLHGAAAESDEMVYYVEQKCTTSGPITVTTNGIESINNKNKTDGDALDLWNNEANGKNHLLVGDDRKVRVFTHTTVVSDSTIRNPAMDIKADGTIGWAYDKGESSFCMTGKDGGAPVDFMKNPTRFYATAFTYDEAGNTFGIGCGGDITSNGGDPYRWSSASICWNQAANDIGNAGYNSGTYRSRFTSITSDLTEAHTNSDRVQSPRLATKRNSNNTDVYLVYYDAVTKEIKLRKGNLVGNRRNMTGALAERGGSAKGYDENVNYLETKGAIILASGDHAGKYTSVAVTANHVVVAWYDFEDQALKIKYAPLTGTLNATAFTEVTVDDSGSCGEYLSMKADSSGALHFAYYDSDGGDLKYAYLPLQANAYTTPVTTVVDALGTVGTYTDITVDSSGKPYIAYMIDPLAESIAAIKVAYPVSIDNRTEAGANIDTDAYTQKWEIMNVPASAGVKRSKLNIGIRNGKPIVGYATTANLEWVVW